MTLLMVLLFAPGTTSRSSCSCLCLLLLTRSDLTATVDNQTQDADWPVEIADHMFIVDPNSTRPDPPCHRVTWLSTGYVVCEGPHDQFLLLAWVTAHRTAIKNLSAR